MSIEDVLSEERKVLKSEIQELEKKFKEWIISELKATKEDYSPDWCSKSYEEEVADNMLLDLKDFEFEQLEVLKQLSSKLEQLWKLQEEDRLYNRHI